MDLKNIIQGLSQDQNKKKFLVIALVVFILILIGTAALFFIPSSGTTPSAGDQLLSDINSLTPPDQAPTITASKQAPIITLSVDHQTIAPGAPAKISWETKNTTDCVNGDGDAVDLTGSISVSPTSPLTFDLLCTGPNGTDLQSLTVDVTSAPIITIYSSPRAVVAGGQAVISWDAKNADRCVDSKGNVLRLSGTMTVTVKAAYSFSMSCTGPEGTTKKSITIPLSTPTFVYTGSDAGSPGSYTVSTGANTTSSSSTAQDTTPSIQLSATPSTAEYNGSATIIWGLKNVTYCVFTSDGPLNGLPPFTYSSGSIILSSLIKTQSYTLSCTKGAGKLSKTLIVEVAPKPAAEDPNFDYFSLNTNVAATFSPIKLSWSAKNAKRCSLKKDGVVVQNKTQLGPNTSTTVYEGVPGNYSYTISCLNIDGVEVTSNPQLVSVINCQFKNGFGDNPEDFVSGKVVHGSDYGRSEKAICTSVYGSLQLSWEDFSRIFNAMNGGSLSSAPGPIDPSRIVPLGTMDLCQYTYYKQKTVGGVTTSLGYFDKVYHGGWRTLVLAGKSPTSETHNKTVHYNQTGTCGYVKINCNPAHDVTGPVTGINSLACLVLP